MTAFSTWKNRIGDFSNSVYSPYGTLNSYMALFDTQHWNVFQMFTPHWREVVHAWRLPVIKRTPAKFPYPGDLCLWGRVATRENPPLDFRVRLPTREIKTPQSTNKPPNNSLHRGPDQVACIKKKFPALGIALGLHVVKTIATGTP